jgi:hypothetical protein
MEQVVTGSTVFRITPRTMVFIKVSANQEFTYELCEEFSPYPQLDFHVWLPVA